MQSSQNDPWTRYYDTENRAYYWYNSETGESQWDDDQTQYDVEESEVDTQSLIRNAIETENTKLERHTPVAESSLSDISSASLSSDELYYWRFLYINAIVVEAPICVIEAILRVLVLIVLILLITIYYLAIYRSISAAKGEVKVLLRDIALTLVAGGTLLFPGIILYIYRNFHPRDEWNLALLPTPIGLIDCRRFLVLTVFGSASLARNVHDQNSTLMTNEIWEDSIYCNPRNLINFISSFQSRDRE